MPDRRLRRRSEVPLDLAEGAVGSGLALVRLAENQLRLGIRREARRSLREANTAWSEAERRSYRLTKDGRAELRRRLDTLREAIDSTRRRIAAPGPAAKVIPMPVRTGWPGSSAT